MKGKQSVLVCLMLSFFLSPLLKGQSTEENLYKYWYYRDRLEYFVMPGTQAGQSLVAGLRNQPSIIGREGIGFGQQHTRMGFYLGVLATEYRLFKDNGMFDELPSIINDINLALDALIRTDMHESGPPWSYILNPPEPDYWDGFFVREDVPPLFNAQYDAEDYLHYFNKNLSDDNIVDLLQQGYYGKPAIIAYNRINCINAVYNEDNPVNQYYNYEDKWQNIGDSAWITEYKNQHFNSQDEVIGVLIGLALVYQLVDVSNIQDKAQEIADKLTNFMFQHPRCNFALPWRSYFPDCTALGIQNGGDHQAFASAINRTRLLFDLNMFFDINQATLDATWASTVLTAIVFNDHSLELMTTQLLCLSDFSSLVPPPPQPRRSIYDISKKHNWETFYLLLYAVLNDKNPGSLLVPYDMQKLNDQLNDAPCGGPFSYANYNGEAGLGITYPGVVGWSGENKFTCPKEAQNDGSFYFPGTFHGLDYMLLYNLAALQFPLDFPVVNCRDRNIEADFPIYVPFPSFEIGSHANPLTVKSIRSITSTSSIDADGNVTYIAGEYIDLLPGFEALSGSEFTAKLESYNCYGLPFKNSQLNPWDNNNLITMYDSSLVIPPDGRSTQTYLPDDYSRPAVYMNSPYDFHNSNDYSYTSEIAATCYPNPAADNLTISYYSEQAGNIHVEIFDYQGILCFSKSFGYCTSGTNEITFSIETLKNGNYSVRLSSGNTYTSFGFVKM